MRYRKIAFKIFIGIFFLTFTSTPLWSGEPGDLVKKVILKDGGNTKERKRKLWEEISPSFNFGEMAKRDMGKELKINNLYTLSTFWFDFIVPLAMKI